MPTFPPGTLAFSGYGDTPMQFTDYDGNPVAQPPSAPVECGSGCDGIYRLTTGQFGIVGGNSPNFGTTGIGVFDADFDNPIDATTSPAGGSAGARDDNGGFYAANNSGSPSGGLSTKKIYRYDNTGAQTDVWTIADPEVIATGTGPNLSIFTVNGSGTIAYYGYNSAFDIHGFALTDQVWAWDLANNLPLGQIAQQIGSRTIETTQGMLAMTNGDLLVCWEAAPFITATRQIVHYNSTGTVLYTYESSDLAADMGSSDVDCSPVNLTRAFNDETFVWCGIYRNDLATSSAISIAQIQLVTGTVLRHFEPDDGAGFEFDGPFTIASDDAVSYLITIDGVERDPLLATFNIMEPVNGIATMRADFDTAGSPIFRPDLDAEIRVLEFGEAIFGGYITAIRERGFDGPNGESVVVETTSADYKIATTRRYVNEVFNPGSPDEVLKDRLQTLVTNYLAVYGITLDPTQVDGPVMDPEVIEDRLLKDVLDQWSVITGYVWDINVDKELRMYAIGAETAPFDLDETVLPAPYFGDITVEPTRSQYANRIYLQFGPDGAADTADYFFTDGIVDTFTLSVQISGYRLNSVGYGYVSNAAVDETLDLAGQGATWEYDPIANTIQRVVGGAPAAGNLIRITYVGVFPGVITVEDAGEIALHTLYELKVPATDTMDRTVATSLANAELAKHLIVLRKVTYSTRERGLAAGQTQVCLVPKRDLDTTAVVVEVVTESEPGGDLLVRRVTAIEGAVVHDDWRDIYRQWLG